MSHPLRVQRKRTKGWRKPLGAVNVDHQSVWGNPFDWRLLGRPEAVKRYEPYLLECRPDLIARLPELRGQTLMCWCPLDQPCHADVLARLANEEGRCLS